LNNSTTDAATIAAIAQTMPIHNIVGQKLGTPPGRLRNQFRFKRTMMLRSIIRLFIAGSAACAGRDFTRFMIFGRGALAERRT